MGDDFHKPLGLRDAIDEEVRRVKQQVDDMALELFNEMDIIGTVRTCIQSITEADPGNAHIKFPKRVRLVQKNSDRISGVHTWGEVIAKLCSMIKAEGVESEVKSSEVEGNQGWGGCCLSGHLGLSKFDIPNTGYVRICCGCKKELKKPSAFPYWTLSLSW